MLNQRKIYSNIPLFLNIKNFTNFNIKFSCSFKDISFTNISKHSSTSEEVSFYALQDDRFKKKKKNDTAFFARESRDAMLKKSWWMTYVNTIRNKSPRSRCGYERLVVWTKKTLTSWISHSTKQYSKCSVICTYVIPIRWCLTRQMRWLRKSNGVADRKIREAYSGSLLV